MADYKITLLKGDGIGPEIVNQAVKVLDCAAEKFGFGVTYDEALLGGCAIDATGVPLPDETVAKCKASDSVLLGAVGGPKWDSQPGNNRPEAGLLGIRGALAEKKLTVSLRLGIRKCTQSVRLRELQELLLTLL